MTRSLKQELYVTAARSLGASDLWILFRHLLRNAAGPLISLTALRMGLSLATASGLSFLGLGPPAPTPDWGSMLDAGHEYLWLAPASYWRPEPLSSSVPWGFTFWATAFGDRTTASKRRRHSTEARACLSGD